MFKMKNKKYLAIFFIGVLVLSVFLIFRLSGARSSDILGRDIALRLRLAKISLGKLGDVLFFPYAFFPSRLPVYELSVDVKDLRALNDALGDWDPDSLIPLRSDKKIKVKGIFSSGEYRYAVKIGLRGDSQVHWAHEKKSWSIEFPDDDFFHGMRRLNLNVPESNYFYVGMLNNYRAKKLGILSPDTFFVRVKLNGKDFGVYLAEEDIGQEWLEKKGLSGFILDFMEDDSDEDRSIFADSNAEFWESETMTDIYTPYPLNALRELLLRADEKAFAQLIPSLVDLESFLAWDVITVLSQSREQNDIPSSNNFKLFFDVTTGKFSIIPYNVRIREDNEGKFYKDIPLLTQRILAVPEFKKRRDEMLLNYISKESNSDAEFYDGEFRRTRGEFLSDFRKPVSSSFYLSEVERFRAYVNENFERAKADVYHDYSGSAPEIGYGPFSLSGPFDFLRYAAAAPAEFLYRYPGFRFEAPNIFRLPAGVHIFTKNLIIPPGYKFIIDPGALVYLGDGISVISYSPLIAEGSPYAPIRIQGLNPDKPWKSFIVIDTGEQASVFRDVIISGGSELKGEINGIFATGMLAFHKADVAVENSRIGLSHGEDALNIKNSAAKVRNNVFFETLFDALDCDSCSGSIEGNTFEAIGLGKNSKTGFGNTGGDAVDVSFSNMEIKDNIIIGATDKGMSIGESSEIIAENNKILGGGIGVAVKDFSRADIIKNIIAGNKSGLELYQKKEIFGPGQARVSNSVFWNNESDIHIYEDGSSIEDNSFNIIESRGDPQPDFSSLLPPEFEHYLR